MRIISSALLMISGACLALGIIHFRFWWADRFRRDYLAFAISCISVAVFSVFELAMMRSATPEEYLFYAWWSFFPGTSALLAAAWFAYVNLRGRRWLFWTFCASRMLAVLAHLMLPNGINFREINVIGRVTILGESLSYQIAEPNPWMVLAQLSHTLLIVFFLDSSIRAWRRGDRRGALVFGTGMFLFGFTILTFSIGVLWEFVHLPLMASFSILFIIAAMVEKLNHELQSAALFSHELIEREAELSDTLQQLKLSAGAANVGLWTRKVGEDKIWISEKAGEIWGYPGGEQLTREDFLKSIYPGDRERVLNTIKELEEQKNEFQFEFRVIRQDGKIRWINTQGKVEQVNGSRVVRGAVLDITKRKMAEEAIHELSQKLINAQEKERARLARELHDDLSQSLALLSIQLSQLRKELSDAFNVENQVDDLVSAIARLSADVHRISHELHPAKLGQLGLELALRGFCRELSAAHPIKIDFSAENVPRSLPDDVSLCLYRVTQESMQNVIKHSGATSAQIGIKLENDEIRLAVSDNGGGFDIESVKVKESLGLISIDERVRAIKGTVKILSTVGTGTKIEARVPFKPTA